MSNDVSLKLLLLGEDRSASKAMRGVGAAVDKTAAKTKRMGGVMKGALSAAVVAQAARAVYDFGKDSVEAYRGAAASQRQLDDAYKRFPSIADVSIKKLREQAAAIEAKTGADADDIAGGQAVLARYKLTGKQISAMTPLLVDYAKRTGKEIPAASGTLGKAIMGNAKAMKELGIKFKDTGNPAKNYELIMAGLKDKVGGFAESEATTLDGKLSILQTKFGNLQESVGEQLVPVILTLADGLQTLVGWVGENTSWLGPLAAGIGAAAAAVGIWTGYQWLLNASLTANPIGLVVAAIGALVAGLVWAYQNVDWFREGVDAAFKGIGDIARWLWNNALAPALRGIVQGFAWVVDGLAGLLEGLGNIPGFEWAKDAAKNLRGMAQSAREAADGIKNIPDPMVNTLPAITSLKELKKRAKELDGQHIQLSVSASMNKSADEIVYKTSGSGKMKFTARRLGGPVKKGETYVVGENEPELFTPDENGTIIPSVPDWFSSTSRIAAVMSRRSDRIAAVMPGAQASGSVATVAPKVDNHFHITVQGDSDPLGAAKRIEQHLSKLRRSRGGKALAFV